MTVIPKVDVHHHIIPPQIAGCGHGLKGMKVPEWTLSADRAFSKAIGVRTTIFSVSTPGVSHITDPDESAAVARAMNEYCAQLRDQDPASYGFFATVPSLAHTALALREIRYALDVLRADGVTLFTWYGGGGGGGGGYLGHDDYVPVWAELDARGAVAFVHPINNDEAGGGAPFNDQMPMPGFDWPHETGRTAMDMILHRRLQQFPAVKVILSHAGGTLPALARRATMVAQPEFGAVMRAEDVLGQARSFYFDLAIAGGPELLPLILGFARPGHVLFGSDYPHAPPAFSNPLTRFIEEYAMDDEQRKEIYHEAAEKLFPRLKGS